MNEELGKIAHTNAIQKQFGFNKTNADYHQ